MMTWLVKYDVTNGIMARRQYGGITFLLSCQDNDYSLVDSLIFIDSQDYRYRTINRCINDDHIEESLMDEVANIALVVESEKGLFRVSAVP